MAYKTAIRHTLKHGQVFKGGLSMDPLMNLVLPEDDPSKMSRSVNLKAIRSGNPGAYDFYTAYNTDTTVYLCDDDGSLLDNTCNLSEISVGERFKIEGYEQEGVYIRYEPLNNYGCVPCCKEGSHEIGYYFPDTRVIPES